MSNAKVVKANGVDICAQTFGDPADPAVLLIAGLASSMDWWETEFCERLAAAGRFVIRYDHRDTGQSVSYPPGKPGYSSADLVDDAAGVLAALGPAQRARRGDLDGRRDRAAPGPGPPGRRRLAHLDLHDGGRRRCRPAVVIPGTVRLLHQPGTRSRLVRPRRGRWSTSSTSAGTTQRSPSPTTTRRSGGSPPAPSPGRTTSPSSQTNHALRGRRRSLANQARRDHRSDGGPARHRRSAVPLRPWRGARPGNPRSPAGSVGAHRTRTAWAGLGRRAGRVIAISSPDWSQRADRLAATAVAAGEPTAWFERLYSSALRGQSAMPWDRSDPNQLLAQWYHRAQPLRNRETRDGGRLRAGRRCRICCGTGFPHHRLRRLRVGDQHRTGPAPRLAGRVPAGKCVAPARRMASRLRPGGGDLHGAGAPAQPARRRHSRRRGPGGRRRHADRHPGGPPGHRRTARRPAVAIAPQRDRPVRSRWVCGRSRSNWWRHLGPISAGTGGPSSPGPFKASSRGNHTDRR